jgi:hypothetical protein
MNFVIYLFVFHEHESLAKIGNYKCYGQEQQIDGTNVRLKIHTSFIKNKWALTNREMSSSYDSRFILATIEMVSSLSEVQCHNEVPITNDRQFEPNGDNRDPSIAMECLVSLWYLANQ